jgi:hypothetical protein
MERKRYRMERKYKIGAIIFAIISAIGWITLIFFSTPAWLPSFASGFGVLGAISSLLMLFIGATSRELSQMREDIISGQKDIISGQKDIISGQKDIKEILLEIRDKLGKE